jgi:hypothetical protein
VPAQRKPSALGAPIEQPVVAPEQAVALGPPAESKHRALRAPIGGELQVDHLARVRVAMAFVALVEAACRQHEEVVIGAGPRFHGRLVLMPVQHQVHAVGHEPSHPFAIGEIGEPVVHERQAEARQPCSPVAGEQLDLVLRQSKRTGVRVVAGEPGRVESDDP